MLAQEEYVEVHEFEEAGMVDLGYCPPCGKRPQDSARSPVR